MRQSSAAGFNAATGFNLGTLNIIDRAPREREVGVDQVIGEHLVGGQEGAVAIELSRAVAEKCAE